MDQADQFDQDDLRRILSEGEITLQGQFVLGYNYTFLVNIDHKIGNVKAIYKPNQGEQPIWDFPNYSLSRRESAAYQISDFLGWDLVPVTLLSENGPFGPGSLQVYIDHDPNQHYFTYGTDIRKRLRPTVLFDLLINNADRKGGHILLDNRKKVWLIDHGLCFHEEEKLRTVVWDFSGEPIPNNLITDLSGLKIALNSNGFLVETLSSLIHKEEITALISRCKQLIDNPVFPHPPEDRRYIPFPPV